MAQELNILKEALQGKDIREYTNREYLKDKAWDSVTYDGIKLAQWYTENLSHLEKEIKEGTYDFYTLQDCYVGYSKNEDRFYAGFNVWKTDGTESSGVVSFEIKNNKINDSKTTIAYDGLFYSGTYEQIHKNYRDIIDALVSNSKLVSTPKTKEELVMSKMPMFNPKGKEADEMRKNIGKSVIFISPKDVTEREVHVIGGVQSIYDGTLAYRVYTDKNTAGRPALPSEITFV